MSERDDPITAKIATELRVAMARMTNPPTNAEIASKANVSAMAVGRYLKGERAIPMPTYVAICEALGLSPSRIMADAIK